MKRYDLVIIGGGAAAFAAATAASENNFSVAMLNAGLPLGGTCANVGCVPSKFLLETAARYQYAVHSPFSAISLQGRVDFPRAIAQKNELIAELRKTNYQDILESQSKTDFFPGYGRFVDARTVDVNGQQIQGRYILIATGTSPFIPPIPGLKDSPFLTNRSALELSVLPEKLLVLGAGPIGLEFGQFFWHFGSEVTVIEMEPEILPKADPLLSRTLRPALEEEGIRFATGTRVVRAYCHNGEFRLEADKNGQSVNFEGTHLLVATGLQANTKALELQNTGVKLNDRGFVQTDVHYRTSVPHIFAAGDVVGPPFLETVAAKEGKLAAENALLGTQKTVNYLEVPSVVFTHPQVASVGITEAAYARRHGVCMCRTIPLDIVPKARILGLKHGVVQLVVNHQTDVIEGAHVVAPNAAEFIHEAALAVKFKLTIHDLIDTVHVFPTLSESLKIAAQAFTRNVFQMTCCVG